MLALLLAVLWGTAVGEAGPQDSDAVRRARFLKQLDSEEVAERARAFDRLATGRGQTAILVGITGVKRVLGQRRRVRKLLTRAVASYERARTKAWEARERYAAGRRRGLALSQQKTRRRALVGANALEHQTLARLQAVRADFGCTRTQLSAAARVLGGILERTRPAGRPAALGALRLAWGTSREPEIWILHVDALVASGLPGAARTLRGFVQDADRPVRLRALALDGLVALDADGVLSEALCELQTPLASNWHLAAAAIQALAVLRNKAGIPALIAFLARQDLGRLREDAHAALRGLTGQRHGPYAAPWEAWWREAHATFEVPATPPTDADGAGEKASPTGFYGIHTFSDRIAYVFDLSGSMWTGTPRRGLRIDTALKELQQAVGTLDASKRFLLVPFGTRATTWRPAPVPATEPNKRALARWSTNVTQRGQTNAYDALDLAFATARATAGQPAIDTIFFLTDGVATTGPLDDVGPLLTEAAIWTRVERVRIHAVGIGEHDPLLLAGLAHVGGGRYVAR